MRTTVDLDPDVLAEVNRLRGRRQMGLSEAVNHLARTGLLTSSTPLPFRQRTVDLGLRIDITDIAEALELLDQDEKP